jgi:transposase
LADEALAALNGRFEALYSSMGRPSIAPEMLLRATLLQALFSVRSERMLMEQISYNLLFRWFVGLPLDGAVWHATVFTHNRDRLLEAEVARDFLAALLGLPQVKALLSSEHFSVDGTLIEAWASMKSFRPKDGSGSPPGPGRNGEREALEREPCLGHRPRRAALMRPRHKPGSRPPLPIAPHEPPVQKPRGLRPRMRQGRGGVLRGRSLQLLAQAST